MKSVTMSDVMDFISKQSEEDQKKIYKFTVDCINEIHRKEALKLSLSFRKGQLVNWIDKFGRLRSGTIVKLGPKNAKVEECLDKGQPRIMWSIAYSFLKNDPGPSPSV